MVIATLLILSLIIGYLLFAPFYLEINSDTDLFRLRFHRLASANLVIDKNSLMIDFRIAVWKKKINLMANSREKVKPAPAKKSRFKMPLGKIEALVKSFKINTCHLNVDLGDTPLNGILYPAVYYLNQRSNHTFQINFVNESQLILQIENNFARMIRAYYFHKHS